MPRTHHIITLITVAMAMTWSAGCEKNVDIDIDDSTPMIVLNGVLKTDSTTRIFLTRSRHILDNKPISAISNAEVFLYEEDGTPHELSYMGAGVYGGADLDFAAGEQFTIEASADGFEKVTAGTQVPQPVELIRMDTSSIVNEWGEIEYDVNLIFQDPPGEKNYYRVSSMSRIVYLDQRFEPRLDTVYETPDTVVTAYVMDTIENFYTLYEPLYVNSEDLVIEEWVEYGNVIFSDKLFDGKQYSFNLTVYNWGYYDAADSSAIYINLESIDESYFKYLNTKEKHYYAVDDPFAVPVAVFNNIENGIGIFGSASVSRDSIPIPPSPYIHDRYYWGY